MNNKDYKEFKKRRDALANKIGDGIAIIFNASETIRNRDSYYPYRSDSYFHYFSGFNEPQSALVILGGKSPKTILFCRNKNVDMEIWNGFIYGPKEAKELFLFDEAYDIKLLDEIVLKEIPGHQKIYHRIGQDVLIDQKINDWIKQLKEKGRAGVRAPHEIQDISYIADEMRLIKIEMLRRNDSIEERIVAIPEHVPIRDTMEAFELAKQKGAIIIGPNTPGIMIPELIKIGIKLTLDDFDKIGSNVPLLANLQPAGTHLMEISLEQVAFLPYSKN